MKRRRSNYCINNKNRENPKPKPKACNKGIRYELFFRASKDSQVLTRDVRWLRKKRTSEERAKQIRKPKIRSRRTAKSQITPLSNKLQSSRKRIAFKTIETLFFIKLKRYLMVRSSIIRVEVKVFYLIRKCLEKNLHRRKRRTKFPKLSRPNHIY